jgi:heme/copper-type cytochrome/quinol oxidase subunit 2
VHRIGDRLLLLLVVVVVVVVVVVLVLVVVVVVYYRDLLKEKSCTRASQHTLPNKPAHNEWLGRYFFKFLV